MLFGTFDTDGDECHWAGLHACFANINQNLYPTNPEPVETHGRACRHYGRACNIDIHFLCEHCQTIICPI